LKQIKIFDTTLRDGEQSIDVPLSVNQKLLIAQQLEKLRVDIIEAGFPLASQDEFLAVQKIADTVRTPIICALGRLVPKDLNRCWEALRGANHPRIHTFIATSSIHLQYKLRKTPSQVLELVRSGVEHAKQYCEDIEFTLEDGSRSDLSFVYEVIELAIESGATTISIPDTVGFMQPQEFGSLLKTIQMNVPKLKHVNLSVHCHNDLGLAVANTLSAISMGVDQVECTINGLGERAGNASLEEIVMILYTRPEYYNARTDINTRELFTSSQLVSSLTKLQVQNNKAIVGPNAFVHKAGIHQHGMLKHKETYEIIDPEVVGWKGETFFITKHSGQNAISQLLKNNQIIVSNSELEAIYIKVKDFIDKNQKISTVELLNLARTIIPATNI
jgi:2-isopropylmalate synthase